MNGLKLLCLLGISLICFTGYLDATIVTTALPAIQSDLQATVTAVQWVLTGLFLPISAFMISAGRVGDIFGRRRMFYASAVIFLLASLGAGFSSSIGWLIFFRVVQGFTIAVIYTVGVTLVQLIFDKTTVAKAMGIFSMITGGGLALGPVIGGVLVTYFGWPAIFFVNIPLGIIGLILCVVGRLAESRSQDPDINLDYIGVILLFITIVGLVYGLVRVNVSGWGSAPVIISLIIAFIALLLLIFVESRVKHPILAGSLFKNRVFLSQSLLLLLGGSLMGVIFFIVPLYLSNILDKSHLEVGFYMFITPVFVVLCSPLIASLNHRFGAKPLSIVAALLAFAVPILALFLPVYLTLILLLALFVCYGITWSIQNTSSAAALSQSLEEKQLSVGLGAMFASWNIGTSVFIALGVTLFNFRVTHALQNAFTHLGISMDHHTKKLLAIAASKPDQLKGVAKQLGNNHDILHALKSSFVSGMHIMFWPLLILGIIVVLFSLFVMPQVRFKEEGESH